MVNNVKIGITGLPGSGKTATLRRVLQMLTSENDVTVGGIIDEKVTDESGRKKCGMKVTDLQTEEFEIFARPDIQSKIMVGSLGVDLALFESISIKAIKNACEQCDIIVIDEVGKIEVESQAFMDAVNDALEIDKPMLITLHKKSRNPLLQEIRRRNDVRILEVTATNRNILPFKIVSLMKGENE